MAYVSSSIMLQSTRLQKRHLINNQNKGGRTYALNSIFIDIVGYAQDILLCPSAPLSAPPPPFFLFVSVTLFPEKSSKLPRSNLTFLYSISTSLSFSVSSPQRNSFPVKTGFYEYRLDFEEIETSYGVFPGSNQARQSAVPRLFGRVPTTEGEFAEGKQSCMRKTNRPRSKTHSDPRT